MALVLVAGRLTLLLVACFNGSFCDWWNFLKKISYPSTVAAAVSLFPVRQYINCTMPGPLIPKA